MPHRYFSFYSGAPAHDMHHLRPLTCFEPWFNYLDKIMGNTSPPLEVVFWNLGYNITYEDLKRMAEEKSKRYGLYDPEDEKGLQKIN